MKVTDLPEAILDKVHDHAYDCQAVGLTRAPCEPNEVTVNTWKLLSQEQPAINRRQATCCRQMNQIQPYFNAHEQGSNLTKAILHSMTADEATQERINMMMTDQTRPRDARYKLVNALLRHVTQEMVFTEQSYNDVDLQSNVLKKMLQLDPNPPESILFDKLYQLDNENHAIPLHPNTPNQFWRRYTLSMKTPDTYECSFEFAQAIKDVQAITYIQTHDANMPDIPGIVINVDGNLFEHCCYPNLFLKMEKMLLSYPEMPVNWRWNWRTIGNFFTQLVKQINSFDMSIFEVLTNICKSYVADERSILFSAVYAFSLLNDDLRHLLKDIIVQESIIMQKNIFINILTDDYFPLDKKEECINKVLELPDQNLPNINCDILIIMLRSLRHHNVNIPFGTIVSKCVSLDTAHKRSCVNRTIQEILRSVSPYSDTNRLETILHSAREIFDAMGINKTGGVRMKTIKSTEMLQTNTINLIETKLGIRLTRYN